MKTCVFLLRSTWWLSRSTNHWPPALHFPNPPLLHLTGSYVDQHVHNTMFGEGENILKYKIKKMNMAECIYFMSSFRLSLRSYCLVERVPDDRALRIHQYRQVVKMGSTRMAIFLLRSRLLELHLKWGDRLTLRRTSIAQVFSTNWSIILNSFFW